MLNIYVADFVGSMSFRSSTRQRGAAGCGWQGTTSAGGRTRRRRRGRALAAKGAGLSWRRTTAGRAKSPSLPEQTSKISRSDEMQTIVSRCSLSSVISYSSSSSSSSSSTLSQNESRTWILINKLNPRKKKLSMFLSWSCRLLSYHILSMHLLLC